VTSAAHVNGGLGRRRSAGGSGTNVVSTTYAVVEVTFVDECRLDSHSGIEVTFVASRFGPVLTRPQFA
jgi:hypothetical protein